MTNPKLSQHDKELAADDMNTYHLGDRTCDWLVRVASGHPEPDSIEDTYRDIECGAHLMFNGYGSFKCEAGHEHISHEDPRRTGQELVELETEREAARRGEL